MKKQFRKGQKVILISSSYKDSTIFDIKLDPIPGEIGMIVKNFKDDFYNIRIRNSIITVRGDMILPYNNQHIDIKLKFIYKNIIDVLISKDIEHCTNILISSTDVFDSVGNEMSKFINDKNYSNICLTKIFVIMKIDKNYDVCFFIKNKELMNAI